MLYFCLFSTVPASSLYCLLFIPNTQISDLSKCLAITEELQATYSMHSFIPPSEVLYLKYMLKEAHMEILCSQILQQDLQASVPS